MNEKSLKSGLIFKVYSIEKESGIWIVSFLSSKFRPRFNLSAKAGATYVTTNKGHVGGYSSPIREPRNPIISCGMASSGGFTGGEGTA